MKKNNGFTLIELLAVIVILAVIALIATPLIMNIIDDAKKEAMYRNVDAMEHSAEIYIAQKNISLDHTESVFVTLRELNDAKVLSKVNNMSSVETCNVDQSGVKVTKSAEGKYQYETTLICPSNSDVDKLGIYTANLPTAYIRKGGIYYDTWYESLATNTLFNEITLKKENLTDNYDKITETMGTKKISYKLTDSNGNVVMLVNRTLEVVEESKDKNLTNEVVTRTNNLKYYKTDEFGNPVPNYLKLEGLDNITFRILGIESNGGITITTDTPIEVDGYTAGKRIAFYPGGYNDGCPAIKYPRGCASYAMESNGTLYNSKIKDAIDTYYNLNLKTHESLFEVDHIWANGLNAYYTEDGKSKPLTGPISLMIPNYGTRANTKGKSFLANEEGDIWVLGYRESNVYLYTPTHSGGYGSVAADNLGKIRPLLVVKPNTKFKQGIGSAEDPYVIAK